MYHKIIFPIEQNTEHEFCSYCGNPPKFIIRGRQNCGYCGNEIPICQGCFNKLQEEIVDIEKEKFQKSMEESRKRAIVVLKNSH